MKSALSPGFHSLTSAINFMFPIIETDVKLIRNLAGPSSWEYDNLEELRVSSCVLHILCTGKTCLQNLNLDACFSS